MIPISPKTEWRRRRKIIKAFIKTKKKSFPIRWVSKSRSNSFSSCVLCWKKKLHTFNKNLKNEGTKKIIKKIPASSYFFQFSRSCFHSISLPLYIVVVYALQYHKVHNSLCVRKERSIRINNIPSFLLCFWPWIASNIRFFQLFAVRFLYVRLLTLLYIFSCVL